MSIPPKSSDDSITIGCYADLLRATSARYPCRGFDVLANPKLNHERFCIVRHDVDMSPERALAVARVEHGQGVRATYMVLLTGSFYNPFEAGVRDQLAEIGALGHHIGLHFDAAWHRITDEAGLTEALERERAILARLLGLPSIDCFSFHNTTPFTMNCRQPQYAGMWNAYAGVLQDHVDYVSDSNGHWRFRSWARALSDDPDRLQVLTHPEWWGVDEKLPAETVAALILGRAYRTWSDYCDLLATNDRVNRSGIERAVSEIGGRHEPVHDDLLLRWLSGDKAGALAALRQLIETVAPADPLVAALRRSGEISDHEQLRRLMEDGAARLANG